jgi:hypothetical protein
VTHQSLLADNDRWLTDTVLGKLAIMNILALLFATVASFSSILASGQHDDMNSAIRWVRYEKLRAPSTYEDCSHGGMLTSKAHYETC